MQMLARGYLVYEITGSASLLGIVAAGSAFPMLALALFGGAIADRFERKKLIQVGQLIVGALVLLVGVSIATDWIQWYHLLAASVIQGAVWALTMPARQVLIPQIVGPPKDNQRYGVELGRYECDDACCPCYRRRPLPPWLALKSSTSLSRASPLWLSA